MSALGEERYLLGILAEDQENGDQEDHPEDRFQLH